MLAFITRKLMTKVFKFINNYMLLPFKIRAIFKKKEYTAPSAYENLLFCPFNFFSLNLARESIMALSCQSKTRKVSALLFDLTDLEFLDHHGDTKSQSVKKMHFFLAKTFLRICGIPIVQYSDYYKKENYQKIKATFDATTHEQLTTFEHHGISIGDLAVSSTIRRTLGLGPDWEDESFVKMFKGFLLSAYITTDIFHKIIQKEQPDKIVMSHAIYISWGTLFRLGRFLDIPVDVYNGSYQKNSLRVYHNIPNAPMPDRLWSRYKAIPLQPAEEKIADDYIKSRADNSKDNIQLFTREEKTDKLDAFIKKTQAAEKSLSCLFTNIVWDAFLFSEAESTMSMLEWLQATIDFYIKNPDAYLIIKAHPAEDFHRVPEQFRVKNLIPKKLPDNIFFIDELTQIKPFHIYQHIDFGLTFISTVIIEMALKNIPVIAAGQGGQFSGKGFTFDCYEKESYIRALNKAIHHQLDFLPDIELARRFLYYRFFREAIPFYFLSNKNNYLYAFPSKEISHTEGLDVICDGILYDGDFIYDWTGGA